MQDDLPIDPDDRGPTIVPDHRQDLADPLPGGGVPKEVRSRYRADLAAGRIVVVAVAGGQPPDTLAALFTQAGGNGVGQWWQPPAAIFAPPELAGPF
ncbi:MAG: hypothetical protein NVS1B1_11720 [Candidatus Limnocylindrales bacterium]